MRLCSSKCFSPTPVFHGEVECPLLVIGADVGGGSCKQCQLFVVTVFANEHGLSGQDKGRSEDAQGTEHDTSRLSVSGSRSASNLNRGLVAKWTTTPLRTKCCETGKTSPNYSPVTLSLRLGRAHPLVSPVLEAKLLVLRGHPISAFTAAAPSGNRDTANAQMANSSGRDALRGERCRQQWISSLISFHQTSGRSY